MHGPYRPEAALVQESAGTSATTSESTVATGAGSDDVGRVKRRGAIDAAGPHAKGAARCL
jgi:hypothetical protein